jgi:hypothetical protein
MRKGFRHRDLRLAMEAFHKAVDLGSPQRQVLDKQIALIQEHVHTAEGIHTSMIILNTLVIGIPALLALLLLWRLCRSVSRARAARQT